MSYILAFLQALAALPKLKELFDEFCAWYVESQYKQMKEERRRAIQLAVDSYNQIPLEEAIGNPNAGKPSGIPGTVIGTTPPPGSVRH